jgi:hypothetical protein
MLQMKLQMIQVLFSTQDCLSLPLDIGIVNFVTPRQLRQKLLKERKTHEEIDTKMSCTPTHFPTRNVNQKTVKIKEI